MIFLGIILTTIFGFLVTALISKKMHLIERIGASYMLGLGLLTLGMFIYSTLGIKITLLNTAVLLIGLIALLQAILTKTRRRVKVKLTDIALNVRKMQFSEKLITSTIGIFFLASLVLALYWPVNQWDALALYDFRAKIIYNTGFFVQIAKDFGYFSHYPLLTSLSHTWVYLLGGTNPRFIYSILFISFILVFYGAVRKFATRKVSMFSALLLTSVPVLFHHSTFSYTNLPYTVYLVSSLIFLYVFITKRDYSYLVLSAIMLGLSRWSRFAEPFWLSAIILVVIYAIYKKDVMAPIVYGFLFYMVERPWKVFSTTFFGNDASSLPSQISRYGGQFLENLNIDKTISIADFLLKNVIIFWRPVLDIFLVALFFGVIRLKTRKSGIFLLIIIINLGILFAGTQLFSTSHEYWDVIPDSARRMAMFFLPLMIYYTTLIVAEQKVFKK